MENRWCASKRADGGESMSESADFERVPDPASDPAGQEAAPSWLEALNGFLERAFLQADVDTGC
jgi:hypothetical protein